MADDDLVYLLRRSTEERAKASKSTDDSVRAAHIGMADAYAAKVGEADKAAPADRATLKLRAV